MRYLLFVALLSFVSKVAFALSGESLELYRQREFAMLRILSHDSSLTRFFSLQERDLKSCSLLKKGAGDLKTVLTCMRFIERERKMRLSDAGSARLFNELDLVCSRLASSPEILTNLLEFEFPWRQATPNGLCRRKILSLVYDQIASQAESKPIAAWALFRRVRERIAPDQVWVKKVASLLSSE